MVTDFNALVMNVWKVDVIDGKGMRLSHYVPGLLIILSFSGLACNIFGCCQRQDCPRGLSVKLCWT